MSLATIRNELLEEIEEAYQQGFIDTAKALEVELQNLCDFEISNHILNEEILQDSPY